LPNGAYLPLLRYADQAKKIVNVAVVNEDKNTRLIDALKAEVDALRKQLAEKESRLGLAPPQPITLYERVEVPVEVGPPTHPRPCPCTCL
jgi:hypothetical protein